MALTEAEKLLTACLKHCGVSIGRAMVVCLLLKEEEQILDMAEYLLSKGKVTDEEAVEQARRIATAESPDSPSSPQ